MGYHSLKACVLDLEKTKRLVRIDVEIDPYLEAAEIQRRVYQARGPAIFFSRVHGTKFPMVSNLFGTKERAEFIFRDAIADVQRILEMKAQPDLLRKHPWRYGRAALSAMYGLPCRVSAAAVKSNTCTPQDLPRLVSWPKDGGPYITLPQVYTEDPHNPRVLGSNLGMYRIQLSGGDYAESEIGLHYQIHRGVGVHHQHALERGEKLRVNIFVGGPPSMTLAAVMPLPEGLPEVAFAGVLGKRRIRMTRDPLPIHADADFCISGYINPNETKMEGPFGDHLGYYSLAHPFPVMHVERVFHRNDAIWPFTVVGRPPQEDTAFGELIHELTAPVIPSVLPGIHGVHAVDAAGVHPLLLAIGSERYQPFETQARPAELLTQANAILGQGQMSLAKYLLIANHNDNASLQVHEVPAFLHHMLERLDYRRDLHFQTQTTMDTLDYSGGKINEGSKVVMAAAGPPIRTLARAIPKDFILPRGVTAPRICLPGVIAVEGPPFERTPYGHDPFIDHFERDLRSHSEIGWIVLVDDSEFTSRTLSNFLWVTFTRSNPATDIRGAESFIKDKHWGCIGPIIIDARIKPHHAPPLEEDPAITKKVDALAAPGGPLHGIL